MKRFYQVLVCILRAICFLVYPYSCSGKENIPEGAAIVCANHTSLLDPLLLAFSFGIKHHLRFMAKKELESVPVVGWVLRNAGIFFVDRGSSDISAVRTSMKILKDGGKVMMFPQGTRVSEEEASDAKTGAVRIATKLNVPILPVYIPGNKKPFRKTHIVVGVPYSIDRNASSDNDKLAEDLMGKISSLKVI